MANVTASNRVEASLTILMIVQVRREVVLRIERVKKVIGKEVKVRLTVVLRMRLLCGRKVGSDWDAEIVDN
jgi:hypothetical protein